MSIQNKGMKSALTLMIEGCFCPSLKPFSHGQCHEIFDNAVSVVNDYANTQKRKISLNRVRLFTLTLAPC